MERKVDEEFDFLGYTMKVEKSESITCNECFFYRHKLACYHTEIRDITGECMRCLRQNNDEVIFKVI